MRIFTHAKLQDLVSQTLKKGTNTEVDEAMMLTRVGSLSVKVDLSNNA
jgi:hypothetical protein